MKIFIIIFTLALVSCGKSNEELSEEAQSLPQKDLSSTWTKQDGSKVWNFNDLDINEAVIVYQVFYASSSFTYDGDTYSAGTYTCMYQTEFIGTEYSGEVTLFYYSGEAFCNESTNQRYIYEISGAQLSFFNTVTSQTSLYY